MTMPTASIYGISQCAESLITPGVHHLTVHTATLRGRGDIAVFIPAECEAKHDLPYVTLLHGACGGALDWFAHGKAHQTLQRMIDEGVVHPMALVTPSDGLRGISSGYLNTSEARCEDWIICDVQKAVQQSFACLSENSPRFIAGLSMGGYGALRLGAKHPQMWRAISGHSSCPDLSRYFEIEPDPVPHLRALDKSETKALAHLLRNRESLPPLRFDCGTEDHLIDQNRALHSALDDAGIAHEYEEFPGGHTWDYWSDKIQKSFRFFTQYL